jgi:hypothetical protein
MCLTDSFGEGNSANKKADVKKKRLCILFNIFQNISSSGEMVNHRFSMYVYVTSVEYYNILSFQKNLANEIL